ncbi:sterol desaturase family protein [Cyclobacterium sp.]|uniref:sterol desaturase family protein n=1 Tax=Cyclobacterium sp. TaxID=1966343 RepID=UPI0019A49E71|nr:sterol desaturase family protein [Cyclobacterium sp.]MBD3628507.1 sterol desaturase family protein [Cyclobacterium sp.]
MKKIGKLDKPDNHGTAEIFKQPILEKITKTHAIIPISLFLLLSAFFLYQAYCHSKISIGIRIANFLGGYVLFTLMEYLMHRYFYHMNPNNTWKGRIQYSVHGIHHDYPKDKKRLAMPPILSAGYAILLYYLFYFLIADYVYYFLPGFLLGYAAYLSIHYIIHAFQPPKGPMKVLWINHAIHHYKDPDVAFGVSTPFWDYVFGTSPKK